LIYQVLLVAQRRLAPRGRLVADVGPRRSTVVGRWWSLFRAQLQCRQLLGSANTGTAVGIVGVAANRVGQERGIDVQPARV
jgi:hypothetical protein